MTGRPRLRSLREVLLAAGRALAWLAAAGLLAFGSAGIVAGVDHPPGSARPELTWAADQAMDPGLTAAAGDLRAIADSVEAVGMKGRLALASLTSRDVTGLSAAIADGSILIGRVGDRTEALRARLESLPGAGPGIERRVGSATLDRYDFTVEALSAVANLSADWSILAGGAATASELTAFLSNHDRLAGEAARAGSTAAYAIARERLARAKAQLDAAKTLRDRLAGAADVSTLDEWLQRNRALDDALDALYAALLAAKGQATPAVRAAVAAERAAQANLPPDTRALVVIMSDIARGGLNQAVISIEQARGRLNEALDALANLPATTALGPGSDAPGSSVRQAASPAASATAPQPAP